MKRTGLWLMLIVLWLCMAGCAAEAPFSRDAFLAEINTAVAAQEDTLEYSCAASEDIRAEIDDALTEAYQSYIVGENVQNITWNARERFGKTRITLEFEYGDSFTDARAAAERYSEESLAEAAEQAILARESELSMLFINDETVAQTDFNEALDRILFGGEYAVMHYYLERAEYAVRTYREYIALTLTLEYNANAVRTDIPCPQSAEDAVKSTIAQWETEATAILYLPEAPANPEAYCRTIVTTAIANDADFAYNCETYYWNAYGTRDCIVTLERCCDYDAQELERMRAEVNEAARELADAVTATDEMQIVREIAQLLCERVSYDDPLATSVLSEHTLSDASNIRRTAYGALVEGMSVCTGYAKAFRLVCDCKGIECWTIDGFVDDVGHEWNAVFIDGTMYYVDVTFADTGNNKAFYLFDDTLYEKEGYVVEENFYIPAA